MAMRTIPIMLALTLSMLLAACGFHLREQAAFALPFQSIYVKSASNYTPFVGEMKRALQAVGVQLADTPDKAQLILDIVSETTGKQILSLSGAGRVREFQLRYTLSFRAYDPMQHNWLPAGEIALLRNLTYDDAQVLAKEQEEALLYQDMRNDAVQQMLRRLNHAQPPVAQP